MTEEPRATPKLDEAALAAARNCFGDAMSWGCEPQDALGSAIVEYLSAARQQPAQMRVTSEVVKAFKAEMARYVHHNDEAVRAALESALPLMAKSGGEKDEGWRVEKMLEIAEAAWRLVFYQDDETADPTEAKRAYGDLRGFLSYEDWTLPYSADELKQKLRLTKESAE